MGELWIILLFAYALGSISPSYFLSPQKRNRFFVILFDVCKGIIPVLLAAYFNFTEMGMYLAGLFAVLGHCFPFYLGFRGGKGLATTIGALLTIWGLYLYGAALNYTTLLIITGVLIVFYFFFMIYLTQHYQKKLLVLSKKKETLEKLEKITQRKTKLDAMHERLSNLQKRKKED